MSLLMEPVRTSEITPGIATDAGRGDESDALLAQAFGFTITHRGAEEELVMGDLTLCCSTTCSCSGAGGAKVK